jgi:hypothetical protein
MAVGLPAKTTYADGDVFSASDINDTNGTLNLVGQELNYYAGKNKIINGDFYINQRNFTSNTTNGVYGFDRWYQQNTDGTVTVTPEVFTPGAAPVAGYEAKSFVKIVSAGQSAADGRASIQQRIEDVRTFANETVTFSLWAKASTGTPNIALELLQNFGTGGSPSASVSGIGATKFAITSSWARYSVTISVPSISGKTIGTTTPGYLTCSIWTSAGSDLDARTNSLGIQNITVDIWGVQVEAGSTATAFQTATGTIQGELAACQRYFNKVQNPFFFAVNQNTTSTTGTLAFPVVMRIAPTATYSAASTFYVAGNSSGTASSVGTNTSKTFQLNVDFGKSSLTAWNGSFVSNNGTSTIEMSSEL